ncbi:MAG: hypothetical protein HQ528_10760 [Candidatus Marinimicrobia bacterium]|nr:hypothetical protein [Candidatus Neomarinimicrobiota bacterium]
MKIILFKLLILFILVGASNAVENRIFWDGGDWKRVTTLVDHNHDLAYQIKAAYINGVLDGRLFYYLKTWAVEQSLADSLYSETVDYLTTRELVTAIDNFYSNPLNGYVPLPSAIIIATMYGEQVSLETIDQYIRQTKFWINELMLKMEDEEWNQVLDAKVQKSLERKGK